MRKRWVGWLLSLFSLLSFHPLGATTHHPQAFLDRIQGTKEEGREIVQHFCATCHAEHPQIVLGAPRIRHPEDWVERCKQDSALLWQHTNEGYHAMPARGGCFECTDDQLKKAILILLEACRSS